MDLKFFLNLSPEDAWIYLKSSYEFNQKDLQKTLESHFIKMFIFARDNKEAFFSTNHDIEKMLNPK